MKQREPDKNFNQLKKDQMGREGNLLSSLLGDNAEMKDMSQFEADLSVKRNEILFKITNDMEDTKNALKQAEGMVEKLRKHLNQLEGIYRTLTKK